MPAFKLPADDEGGEEIFFRSSLSDIDPEVNGAVPAPEFDQYESLGYVPSQAFVENGWWLHCDECDRVSDCEEDDDYDGRIVEHVFRGQLYFCHPECEKAWLTKRDLRRVEQDVFRLRLTTGYPGLQVKKVIGGGEYGLYSVVEFPGGKGSITQDPQTKALEVHTNSINEWNLFVEKVDA